jgi:hypothetical protein
MEHVETYGDFTSCAAGKLTGKMGTRPKLKNRGFFETDLQS